jgi:ParB family chromosome partitioning protein
MTLDLSGLSDISALLSAQNKGNGLRSVRVDAIRPDPNQPRKSFDEASLTELAESIRAVGIIQPPVVSSQGDGYLLISGERRWRAVRQLGWDKIEVIVRDDLNSRAQLVENIQREDLSAWEIYRVISAELATGVTHAELAKSLGKSRTWVTAYAAIDNMPPVVVSALRDGRVTGLTALRSLQQLHIAKPEVAAELLNRSEPIDQPLIERATRQAAELPEVAGSDPLSPKSVDGTGGGAPSQLPAGKVADETSDQLSPSARQPFPTSDTSLPVRILVGYRDASWAVDYRCQCAIDGVASVKLVSEKQGACFAPVSSLTLQSIELP